MSAAAIRRAAIINSKATYVRHIIYLTDKCIIQVKLVLIQ